MRLFLIALLFAISYAQTAGQCDCLSLEDAGLTAAQFVNTEVKGGVPRTLFEGNYGGYCSDWETRRGAANGGLEPESPYTECQADAFRCEASKADLSIADGASCGTAVVPSGAAEGSWQDMTDASKCEIEFENYLPDNCVGELISTFCDDSLNWCVLQWCYVSEDCPSREESNYFGPEAFVSGTVETQLYYSYLACGTPDCYTHTLDSIPDNAPFGCPYDPLGTYGCPATEIEVQNQHPINTGCPAGSGSSALKMNFTQARVIHRNLNGQFCDPNEWDTDGSSRDNSVLAGEIETVAIASGKRLPADCFYKTNGAPDINRPIPNQILFCFLANEFQNTNADGDELCLKINETTTNYRCENTEKCGDVLHSEDETLCSSDCKSKLGQIQLDLEDSPQVNKTMDLVFTVVACSNPTDEPCKDEMWDEMIMTFLDIDGNDYRMEELVFRDVWDYHLTSIDSIVEGNDGEYPACPQMLESCTGNGETPVEVIPSGAKKVMNSDGSCKYVSPLAQITGVDSDGNPIDESTKTLMDQWAYSIDGTYLYSNEDNRQFSRGVVNDNVCLDSITAWHAIYPDEDTIGDVVGSLDIVDNSKFRTQRGVMFPHMNIQISDPNRVYRWLNTRLGDNIDDYFWVDDRSTGDVIVRNRDDINKNGNIDNPTSLDTLSWDQASRAVAPQWVSEKFLAQRYFNIDGGRQRSSFEVRMGTEKRTILFSGQANALSSECLTCQSGFFDVGGECPTNYVPVNLNRICEIEGHAVVPDLANNCNADYCCIYEEPPPTSHGDPIIWTFNNECYDLDKDGLYSATKHPYFNHEVKIAVYNNYMREIQVVDTRSGEILLSIDTTGNAMSDKFRYHFAEHTFNCPADMKETECLDEFTLWEFDAQNFRFTVHLLRHDYLDAGLSEGELGYHLDIYPRPFKSFKKKRDGYTGLYFENPLPEELEYCAGGSKNSHSRYMD